MHFNVECIFTHDRNLFRCIHDGSLIIYIYIPTRNIWTHAVFGSHPTATWAPIIKKQSTSVLFAHANYAKIMVCKIMQNYANTA